MIAIYARQSVEKEDSISIESQIDLCKKEFNNEPYKIYCDKGFSGKNTNRPEFKKMVGDIKLNIISKVIVYKLDRISRSILDFSNMMSAFEKYNVEFVSHTEKFDTSTPMGRAMLNICIVFAQLERETIQMRVKDAYSSRCRKGFYMGGRTPYGFNKENCVIDNINTSKLVPIAEEVAQIQYIYKEYSKPASVINNIVKQLKINGITKRKGIDWCGSRITEILRNPIYVKADINIYNYYKERGTNIINSINDFNGINGCYLYSNVDKTDNPKLHKNMSNYKNLILVIAPSNGIIDSETWLKCRYKSEDNIFFGKSKQSVHTWLHKKLKCRKCGYALRYAVWENKTQTIKNEYYVCSATGNTKNCEGIGAIKKDFLEETIWCCIKTKLNEFDLEYAIVNSNQNEDNKLINNEILILENEINTLMSKLISANDSVMKYINLEIEKRDKKLTILNDKLLSLNRENTIKKEKLKSLQPMSNKIKNFDNISFEEKREIADLLIKKILIDKENIEIIWSI
ncbi:MAG: recombinase family protein [Oscillospiraceae bacterium]